MAQRSNKFHKTRHHFKKNLVKSIESRTIRKLVLLSKKEALDYLIGLPALSQNDKLLNISDNLKDTCINRGIEINEYNITEAYMDSAILLLTMIELTNSNLIRDGLIFPAFFSFRHYLELTMKDSINRFKHVELDDLIIQREHNLCKLWTELSSYIEDCMEKEFVSNLIFEMNRIDKNGESFRYPYEIGETGFKLQNNLPSGLNNVRKLKTTMLKLFRYFDGINSLAQENIIY